jgi:hypothetical protein
MLFGLVAWPNTRTRALIRSVCIHSTKPPAHWYRAGASGYKMNLWEEEIKSGFELGLLPSAMSK